MDLVKNIYNLRQKFVLIGLTGRTGSGCSTVANLLKSGFAEMLPPVPTENHEGISNDERKYRIEYNYLKSVWANPNDEKESIQFQIIKASDIIFFYVLTKGFDSFINSIEACLSQKAEPENIKQERLERLNKKLEDEREDFEKKKDKSCEILTYLNEERYREIGETNDERYKEAYNYLLFLLEELPYYRKKVMEQVKEFSEITKQFQFWGNNIRKYKDIEVKKEEVAEPSELASTINKIIKLMRKVASIDARGTFIIIDALRNPYEVYYFRERYSAFYLMSITTSEKHRRENLAKANYRADEIDELDGMEYPSKRKDIEPSYSSLDVERCIEISDIHVSHNNEQIEQNYDLKRQIIHFVSLILHPGLVQPTHEERLMQIAYTAKLNSGCISRQVGAVVTDKNYSIKAIGWNTVAKGQTPCSLRCLEDLFELNDLTAFSEFEKSDKKFREEVCKYMMEYKNARGMLNGIPLAYCFKDLYTSLKGEKNQVHTRSLHAEENAFLQLAKYGSEGIDGGFLFTTASPCELCAKKAYQLGITKVFYIDIYPGSSASHIFHAGERKIELIPFRGAIGRAYEALYTPFFPLKDEIKYLTGVKMKSKQPASPEKEEAIAQNEVGEVLKDDIKEENVKQ